MASAHMALGRLDDALDQYRQLAKIPDAPPAVWTEVARLLILRNLQRDQQEWREVDEALRQAEKALPQSLDVLLLHAEALVAQKQMDRAHELLTKARQQQPQQVELWVALAALAERQGEADGARRLLEEAERHCGVRPALRLAWARYWANHPGAEARAALAELGRQVDQFPDEEQARLLKGLAEAYYRLGNLKDAQQLWTRLAEQPRFDKDLRLRLLLFDLALQTGDDGALRRLLADLERLEGGREILWHYCQASRLIWLGRQGQKQHLDEARLLLDAVAARRPGWPAVLLAKADIEDLKGNPEVAIANYRRALELGERNPRVLRQLVQLLYQRQRYAEADQEIRRLQKQLPRSTDLQRLAADISLRNQDPVRAVQLAQQAVSADSTDYRDHLWLGQILAASERRSVEAERRLRRAVELADNVPETWVALVQYLARTEQKQEAEAALHKARAKLPADQGPLALAQSYEALGHLDQAQEQYQAALTAKPNEVAVLRSVASFYVRAGRSAGAEPHLRRILDRKLAVSDQDVGWARRSLALVLAEGDHARFPEGLSLDAAGKVVPANQPPADDPLEEQRAQARVLATQKRRHLLRTKAIALLVDLHRRQALTPEDQFLLSQLYEADGAWPKAREQLRGLLAAHAKNPRYLAHAVQSYIRQRELDEAERALGQLEQVEKAQQVKPGAFGSVELRAQMLEARGQVDQALALLQSYSERPDVQPEKILVRVGYLARQKRVQEALDLCERAWATCAPEAVGGASVAVLRLNQPSEDQCARVEAGLKAAIAKNPKTTLLLLHLADLQDLRGRFTEAEVLYRQVLEREPRNIVALNNLAWLLAQRSAHGTEALPLINRAIETLGPSPELLDTRAAVHLAMGQSGRAIADFREATLDSPTAARYFRLARAYLSASNRENAVAAFKKAKAAGIEATQLHPVERVAYRKIFDELDQR
jgi:tetratricopeptide (TPR) repeat protein